MAKNYQGYIMRIPLISMALVTLSVAANNPPPALNLDISNVSVSGLSSGGYMATQFHLAHSDWVNGAGIIAAGPYYCGRNSIVTALNQCVNKVDSSIPLVQLDQQAQSWAEVNKLAPIENLKHSKIWLLHGTNDQTVITPVTDALATQYIAWAGTENVKYVNDKSFAHHFPTIDKGNRCDTSASPFLGNCDYDAAGELLTYINGPLHPRAKTTDGKVVTIDQQKLGGSAAQSLAKQGYLYVPNSCQQGQSCSLHINFHGCNQYAGAVGETYVRGNGLNNWAETNNMVVFYPQTKSSTLMPLNPQGCWDWWGYTSSDYANQNGPQIQAVTNIVNKLAAR